MIRTTSATNAEHYLWGDGCDGWHLVRMPALSIIEERMPPGTSELRHFHERAQQFFYVLGGELTIEVDGTVHLLKPNEGLAIPPGVPHQARNEGTADARFLVTSQPPSHGDRVNV